MHAQEIQQDYEFENLLSKRDSMDKKNHKLDVVTYDDMQKLKLVESVALQQIDADMTESVAFNFEDIDLVNVTEYMEKVHKVKFITDDILDTNKGPKLAGNKVSFRTNAPLSKQESWDLFITFLSMAGLDVVPMAHAGFYKIVPLPGAPQEAIPSYIGASPELLPDNDMVIRYVYFLQNADPLKIQPLISKFQGATGSLNIYKDLKALIFTDKAYNIKSLMTIVKELDKPVAPQALSVVKLKKANVEDVINLYNSLKPSAGTSQRAWAPDSKDPATEFFSNNIILSGDKRTNTLIILGPKDAIVRLEEFIAKYVDVDANTPKAPVFVYYLEYTNATEMQKTLTSLVSYGSSTSAGQYGGVRDGQKYLQPMTIVADVHSNSLIVNATAEDYVTVEELIKKLDVPQKQIALEVLMVQVTSIKTKQLGSQISGPNSNNTFLQSVSAQTSGAPPVTGIQVTQGNSGVASDLAYSIKSNLASLLVGPINQAGSTLLTFGKSSIWAVFKILKTIVTTKILQNPFMVVSNGSQGMITVGTTRRVVTGEAIVAGGAASLGYADANANMSVTIRPQINEQKMITLTINIDNNQFVNDARNDAVQNQKTITTMATVADGEVLVLGGIMADEVTGTTRGVPFLSKIPIFGWLFKSKTDNNRKDIFMVFISPKILDNVYSQTEVQEYTRNKIEETQDYLRLMDGVEFNQAGRDPLDRAFFGSPENKFDDITPERLLDRKEIISSHEKVKKEKVIDKPKKSKYHKKNAKKLVEKNVVVVPSFDISEDKENQPRSINSIKNILQSSSGVVL
jgi:general secretion pathway protein D